MLPDDPSALEHNQVNWEQLIPEEEWLLYRAVLDPARERNLPFALGGGLAFSAYCRRWRNTKDMDLFILPSDKQAMIDLLRDQGFEDFYDRETYDRSWIFRGFRDDVIIDLIWQLANDRAPVDPEWLADGHQVTIRGLELRLLPVEELIWSKLYVLQHDRCDWPDIFNILYAQGPDLDWDRLLTRLGSDRPLFSAVMNVFAWLCPSRARQLPDRIWLRLGLSQPSAGPDCTEDRRRINLLDSRDWFGAKSDRG